MPTNRLYLAVLPFIHLSPTPGRPTFLRHSVVQISRTEQVLTLFPDRTFATEFFPDEVEDYVRIFNENAAQFLTGGHVAHYELTREPTDDGRMVVRVDQYVS